MVYYIFVLMYSPTPLTHKTQYHSSHFSAKVIRWTEQFEANFGDDPLLADMRYLGAEAYLATVAALVLLYPVCLAWRRYKSAHSRGWPQYV